MRHARRGWAGSYGKDRRNGAFGRRHFRWQVFGANVRERVNDGALPVVRDALEGNRGRSDGGEFHVRFGAPVAHISQPGYVILRVRLRFAD